MRGTFVKVSQNDLKIIFYVSGKIEALSKRIKEIKGYAPEALATVLYIVLHIVISMFHEPWYDEAEAWQIAKCASLKEILFAIPHYEGHPPLWHLILAPFAKLGAPYEASLMLISLIFAGTAVSLIIWKAPFPRIIRLLVPFTYFFFYQYGVIARPYCMMLVAVVLVAMNFSKRNVKPMAFVGPLLLLCLTSAYGIVLAGGISLVWVWEIAKEHGFFRDFAGYFRDKRFYSLALLLVLTCIILVLILPREDTYATVLKEVTSVENNFAVRLLYLLFILLPDVLLMDVFDGLYLSRFEFFEYPSNIIAVPVAIIIGCVVWYIIVKTAKSKIKLAYFVVPYLCFALFSSAVYFALHHSGIGLLILFFWAWINCGGVEFNQLALRGTIQIKLLILFVTCCMAQSLVWSVSAGINEVRLVYSVGKKEAQFIKEHDLDQYRIMASWMIYYEKDKDTGEENLAYISSDESVQAVQICPYFDRNIFYNVNHGEDSKAYDTHIFSLGDKNDRNYQAWKDSGEPDVIFSTEHLRELYSTDEIEPLAFLPVYRENIYQIWKTTYNQYECIIYVRRTLMEKLGLEWKP